MLSDIEIARDVGRSEAMSPVQESIRQRLQRTKASLETRLEDINKVLVLLDENPKLEEFHDLLRRV